MKKWFAWLLVLVMLGGGIAVADYSEEAWYAGALEESVVSPGNNLRIKKVIERAQAGERITIATVGGSITEGVIGKSNGGLK